MRHPWPHPNQDLESVLLQRLSNCSFSVENSKPWAGLRNWSSRCVEPKIVSTDYYHVTWSLRINQQHLEGQKFPPLMESLNFNRLMVLHWWLGTAWRPGSFYFLLGPACCDILYTNHSCRFCFLALSSSQTMGKSTQPPCLAWFPEVLCSCHCQYLFVHTQLNQPKGSFRCFCLEVVFPLLCCFQTLCEQFRCIDAYEWSSLKWHVQCW